ncbi:fatty acid desaturase [Chamaesiphon minutus]|uniref:Fatty acid desaturase n=1 Tax=Chamaesiphon minutus (strain ATCC 27169 / PCC 6605) TaxID=1173020 RepID=K9ULC3_CHAP6|nr:fatty acid desaturase [Chamaesiphon minutus]AFY95458.1 fatty acid desaturase [Chamaesiphon minutus PCC 6605]
MISPNSKNIVAIAYTFISYSLGILLILSSHWQLNILGIIAIVHSLSIATALTHEFIHGNIFKQRTTNAWWGRVMTHLNGACYAPWENLVEHHFNHHLHHLDVVRFDVVEYLNKLPSWWRSIYVVLEWLYFPVMEFEMRWRIISDPFLDANKRSLRGRTLIFMLYRATAFVILAWLSWKALLLYSIAYISFVNVMRFVDAFHHIYDYAIVGSNFIQRDRVYEQARTFSNLISVRYPWLNLLFLNFGYHNAHHHNMSCPWHELPALHNKLYGNSDRGLFPLPQLVFNYHRFRIDRLFAGQGEINLDRELKLDDFIGGVAVSLLTPP